MRAPVAEIAEIMEKRREFGVSRCAFARMAGINVAYYGKLERGEKRNPSEMVRKRLWTTLKRLATEREAAEASERGGVTTAADSAA